LQGSVRLPKLFDDFAPERAQEEMAGTVACLRKKYREIWFLLSLEFHLGADSLFKGLAIDIFGCDLIFYGQTQGFKKRNFII
jgi:hypothetical protein